MGINKLKTDIYISKLNSYIPEFIKNHKYDGYIHQYIIVLLAVYVDAFCPDDNFEKHLKDEIDYVLSLKTHSEYASYIERLANSIKVSETKMNLLCLLPAKQENLNYFKEFLQEVDKANPKIIEDEIDLFS